MAALTLIHQKKRALTVLALVATLLFGAELLALRLLGGLNLSGPAVALLPLPALAATVAFFPLWYSAWFGRPLSRWARFPLQAFFWGAAASVAVFWLAIYWAFLLPAATVAA